MMVKVFTHGVFVVIPKDEGVAACAMGRFFNPTEFREVARSLDQKLAIARSVFDGSSVRLGPTGKQWRITNTQTACLNHMLRSTPLSGCSAGNPAKSTASASGCRGKAHGLPMASKGGRWTFLASPCQMEFFPLASVAGQEPASERLRLVLAEAYGEVWSAPIYKRSC